MFWFTGEFTKVDSRTGLQLKNSLNNLINENN
jgi:hypothetical protein